MSVLNGGFLVNGNSRVAVTVTNSTVSVCGRLSECSKTKSTWTLLANIQQSSQWDCGLAINIGFAEGIVRVGTLSS